MKKINIYGDNVQVDKKMVETIISCRGVVIRQNKILITFARKLDIYMLPGGKLEKNETERECCIREIIEETGIVPQIYNPVLEINEHYDNIKWVNKYFIAKAINQRDKFLTEKEKECELETIWMSIAEIMNIFSHYNNCKNKDIKRRGIHFREYNALKEIFNYY